MMVLFYILNKRTRLHFFSGVLVLSITLIHVLGKLISYTSCVLQFFFETLAHLSCIELEGKLSLSKLAYTALNLIIGDTSFYYIYHSATTVYIINNFTLNLIMPEAAYPVYVYMYYIISPLKV